MRITINGIEQEIDIQHYIRTHKRIDISAIHKNDRKNLATTACILGDTQLMKDCVDIGVDVTDPHLIESSTYYGFYEITQILLDNGANPYGCGGTLVCSYARGHKEVYQLISKYMRGYKLKQLLKK